jgi:hypothetical protein
MAGYLDQYGAGDERRERMNRWFFLAGGVAAGALVVWWFLFAWDKSEIVREPHVARLVQKLRHRGQENEVRQFLDLIKNQKYEDAYRLWGPNTDYPLNRFIEDWGPQGQRSLSSYEIVRSRSCGSGVVITINFQKGPEENLWVQKSDRTIGFSPFAAGCPASP